MFSRHGLQRFGLIPTPCLRGRCCPVNGAHSARSAAAPATGSLGVARFTFWLPSLKCQTRPRLR